MNKSVQVSIGATPSKNNPEFGFVQVAQTVSTVVKGWLRESKRTALINGTMESLKRNYSQGQELAGKIIAIESLTPINEDDLEQGVKMAGDSGIVCSVGGKPIYRTTELTEDLSASDILVAHDNGDAISAFYVKKAEAEKAELS
jgi:hypothetical protein